MLRRRILASAMASVMALSSVAVVASAGEEATTNVKRRADLEALVKKYDTFRENEIFDQGTKAGEQFLSALEYADNVLADGDAGVKDYTAAYLMVEALSDMKIYTAADLDLLIKQCKGVYDKQNIISDEIGDIDYDENTFLTFTNAYDAAQGLLNSDDTRLTTDAWLDLNDAYNSLKPNERVKKSEFRTALREYEAILKRASDYDTWRRGAMTSWRVNFGGKSNVMEYADVMTLVKGDASAVNKDGDSASVTGIGTGTQGTVQAYINYWYKYFDDIKSATYTTNSDIVAAYNTCKNAVEVYNSWQVDDNTKANKAKVAALLKQYHNQLVAEYRAADAMALYTVFTSTAAPSDWIAVNDAGKITGATLKNDAARKAIDVDANGFYPGSDKSVYVAKGSDILRFIEINETYANDIIITVRNVDGTTTNVNLMDVVAAYNGTHYTDNVGGLDTIKQVSKGAGSAIEWTLIWRALKYQLEDKYPTAATVTNHTLKELEKLIADAYELCDKTGEAAIFDIHPDAEWTNAHTDVVKMRQQAIQFIADDKKGAATMTLDDAYDALNNAYTKLDKLYHKYFYSYLEIRDYLYEVALDLDNGVFKDDAGKIADQLSVVAKDLSVLKASDEENPAFTSDRLFQPLNRLKTTGDDRNGYERNLLASYEALEKMVKEAVEASKVKLGDVNGDGFVNILDAVEIAEASINNVVIDVAKGDVTGDGLVNILDAIEIANSTLA